MEFKDEDEAVEYTIRRLKPYCATVVREPKFTSGLRPDIGVRLKGLEDVPIAIECKKFKATRISPFPDAVAQASQYSSLTGHAAFVAPFHSENMSGLMQPACRFESGLLVAGQMSVGILYFTTQRWAYQADAGFVLGGVQVAHLCRTTDGDHVVRLHNDARRLLKAKQRNGSRSWR